MLHTVFEQSDSYPVALLIKHSAFNHQEIEQTYVTPIDPELPKQNLIAVSVPYNENNKAPNGFIKQTLEELLPALESIGVSTLYCADSNYFKVLTKQTKAEVHLGYVLPCCLPDYEHFKVVLGVNHKSLIYNPLNTEKLELTLKTLVASQSSKASIFSEDILKKAIYPTGYNEIKQMLENLHQYPLLSCDIETASLSFEKAGIATISFSWNQHEGTAFPVDYVAYEKPEGGLHGRMVANKAVRLLLREFFETYKGKLLYHNSTFDTKVLIYTLWMKDTLDTEGLLEGLHVMYRNTHDTKLIAYLALNSTAGNELKLKVLAREFAGNWAKEEIKNVLMLPLPELLKYNLVDGICTNYVFNKYYPILKQDEQEDIYLNLMMPSQKVVTQVELTGMPLNPKKVQEARQTLEAETKKHEIFLQTLPEVKQANTLLTKLAWEKDYESRKFKAKNPDKIQPKDWDSFPAITLNFNSGKQLEVLLHSVMQLPIIDLTDTGQPSTGKKTLNRLKNHTKNKLHIKIIESLISLSDAQKILSTFIPAFENAINKGDGVVWLHGSFNMGGTVSGRMSSSDPNLQNIPAGSTYGKLVKGCFTAPEGWLFAGADFNSLEDYISALTTKDPNKLRVYLEGFDGHCLRAFSYFPERLPGITNTVESINSIEDKFPQVRQDSKGPTFCLTYQGTHHSLINNLGFDVNTAKQIEKNYHELYKVSDAWVQDRLELASKNGFITVAFGLRVRTPLLGQTLRNTRSTPYEAMAEGRTAGNAMGQSYGLLNNRAMNEFMEKVWASPFKLDIKPVALIHDALYFVVRNSVAAVHWLNTHLIECMQWQELPELRHDKVKLGAGLEIFYPSWANPISIPNNASINDLIKIANKGQ